MAYVTTTVPTTVQLSTLSNVTSMRDLMSWLSVNHLTTTVVTNLNPMVTINGHHWRDITGRKIKLPLAKQLITDVLTGVYPIK